MSPHPSRRGLLGAAAALALAGLRTAHGEVEPLARRRRIGGVSEGHAEVARLRRITP